MNTTRRNLLTMAATAVPVIAVASSAVASTTHPDAELLAAYEKFRAVDFEYNLDPNGYGRINEDEGAMMGRWIDAQNDVIGRQAKTPAGMAVLALMAIRETDYFVNSLPNLRAWDGHSKPNDVDDDVTTAALWAIVESANAIAKAVQS